MAIVALVANVANRCHKKIELNYLYFKYLYQKNCIVVAWHATFYQKNNSMKKEILINRFKAKVSNRKRFLFARYEAFICSNKNASIIAEEISEDLGVENLVNVLDIYYCRRYFAKKRTFTFRNNLSQKSTNWEGLKWTDPFTIPREKLRSKFSKPDE